MRLPILVLALILPVAAAAAQNSTPRQMMEEMGLAPSRQDVAQAVERARDRPLGTAANPVRVSGPDGEHGYIARLRCADGNAPRVGDRHNDGVGAFGTIVDVWPLDCGDAAPGRFELVMDMYHDDHEETQAPAGFTLSPGQSGAGGSKPSSAPEQPTV
jgi:hypothetical protein